MAPSRDGRLAASIARRHGLRVRSVGPVANPGAVNRVFAVDVADGRYVVRFAVDPQQDDVVDAEAWATGRAAGVGVPSPVVVAVDRLDGVPYLVERFVEGRTGTSRRSPDLWRTLGGYARAAHAVPLTAEAPDSLFTRFGRDLPAAWTAHLRYGLDGLTATDPLIALGVYAAGRQDVLRRRLRSLETADLTFGLNHGDLALRNLVVPDDGPPVLIDWGSVNAGPSPLGDLVTLLEAHRSEGDPSDEELVAFTDGYGADLEGLSVIADDVALLGALDLVRWAIDRRPDRLPATVDAARQRVADQLDRT